MDGMQDPPLHAGDGVAGIATGPNSRLRKHMTAANDLAVRRALEAAGVEFIDQNGGGAGVRLRAPTGKGPKRD